MEGVGGQQRGCLNEEISFREPLISQEMPVTPDTEKKATIQISNCIQGLPVTQDFVLEQALPVFATV